MIPKRIYYIWFGRQSLPEKVKNNIKSWKKFNPDFEIIQINEDNFNLSKYNFANEAYSANNWAFASDLARLDVIYNYGGFYFDTDVKLIKSLEKLRYLNSVWALENSNAINSGLIIGAHKNDSNIRSLLDIYSQIEYSSENLRDIITVPIITKYFQQKGLKFKNKYQRLKDNTVILPTEYFAPFHWWGGGRITDKTIGIHQYDSSWEKNSRITLRGKISQKLIYYWPEFGIPFLSIYNSLKK